MKTHYDTLCVSHNASHKEIKAAFRRLSLETHPDAVGKASADVERFKLISEAHRVLSNTNERRQYDLQIQDQKHWGPMRRKSAAGHAGHASARAGQYSGSYGFADSFYKPRNLLVGVAVGLCTYVTVKAVFGLEENKRRSISHGKNLVEAWRNPETGMWEQPAPWDEKYRRLKPTLHLVPREQVRHRSMR